MNVCTPVCTHLRQSWPHCDLSVHTSTASIGKLPSGSWRAQVRRKGRYIGETFRRHKDTEEWALAMERRIDRGETPSTRVRRDPPTFGDLVDLHLADLEDIGKCPRRSRFLRLVESKVPRTAA